MQTNAMQLSVHIGRTLLMDETMTKAIIRHFTLGLRKLFMVCQPQFLAFRLPDKIFWY